MSNYFITGVSSGLGLAFVRELAQRGDRVWGISRRGEQLEQIDRELRSERVILSVCDVTRKTDILETSLAMQNASFIPDVVILNAGINYESREMPFSLDVFEEILRVNLFGALAWVEVFLPVFRSRNKGQFVAISSLAAFRGDARWIAYAASKAALSRSFESLRGRYAGQGISFTTIHLGAVASGMGTGARNPFRLSENQATNRILSAIERRVDSVTIPRFSRVLLFLTLILPDLMFSRLVAKAFSKPEDQTPKPAETLSVGNNSDR